MSRIKRWKNCFSENLLMMLTVAGIIMGVILGFILKFSKSEDSSRAWTKREIMYLQFPGDLFLRMLKSLILPLIISSIVSAIGSLDLNLSGKIGIRSIYYYATTTICAVILGVILVTTIQPGTYGNEEDYSIDINKAPKRNITTTDTLLDLVRNVFPPNLVQACLFQYRTELKLPSNTTNETSKYNWDISSSYDDGTNTLGLVTFGVILGITISKMGDQGKPLLEFFNCLSEAMMIITNWVIWLSPMGVTFLVASQILIVKNFRSIIESLSMYFLTVLLGLLIHGFGTLSIIFFVCTRELPFRAIGRMSQVMITAFGTASSSATLPITLQCMDNMGVDSRISRFVVPIGATINMDGTALYEAVAAIFIAQVRHVPMNISKIIGVSITATAASIGAAGIPQAGLVTMVMVLNSVGLPDKDVTLILAVDWLLDRFRTTVNVMCDALAAIIIDKMSKVELDSADNEGLHNATELAHLRKIEN
ncbi:PREDICTED: excitatory amino acid transporter 1-like [Ceratosolen solmsi marchali]|uniref:Amino acid transporter n=1 Tax=Ceratosolen solmsi marchali TaxID=326594 RepID=A0AAJ6YMU0_9HYME|nr:PREDICTED: excitatory amino acid transporter 1-like [Ceratosolen solmsi marchali]